MPSRFGFPWYDEDEDDPRSPSVSFRDLVGAGAAPPVDPVPVDPVGPGPRRAPVAGDPLTKPLGVVDPFFAPMGFEDFVNTVPGPPEPVAPASVSRSQGTPLREMPGEMLDAAVGGLKNARMFGGNMAGSVARNIGNMADLVERYGRAAIDSRSLNPAIVAPQAAITLASDMVNPEASGEGLFERHIANPVQNFFEGPVAGGPPETKGEQLSAMGGQLGGEVSSLFLTGGPVAKGLSWLDRGVKAPAAAGFLSRISAQAGAKLPSTGQRVASGAGQVVRRTGRDLAYATPYNVANALDEKDSLAGVMSEIGGLDIEGGGALGTAVDVAGRVGDWGNQSTGRRLATEFGVDAGLSGAMNLLPPVLRPVAQAARRGALKTEHAAFGGASRIGRAENEYLEAASRLNLLPDNATPEQFSAMADRVRDAGEVLSGMGRGLPDTDDYLRRRDARVEHYAQLDAARAEEAAQREAARAAEAAQAPDPATTRVRPLDVDPEVGPRAEIDPELDGAVRAHERALEGLRSLPDNASEEDFLRASEQVRATADRVTEVEARALARQESAPRVPRGDDLGPEDVAQRPADPAQGNRPGDLNPEEAARSQGTPARGNLFDGVFDDPTPGAGLRATARRGANAVDPEPAPARAGVNGVDPEAAPPREGVPELTPEELPTVESVAQELGDIARPVNREQAIKEALTQLGLGAVGGAAVAKAAHDRLESGGEEDLSRELLASGGTMMMLIAGVRGGKAGASALDLDVGSLSRRAAVDAASNVVAQPKVYGAALMHRGITGADWEEAMVRQFGDKVNLEASRKDAAKVYEKALDRVIDMPHMAATAVRADGTTAAPRMASFEEVLELASLGISHGAGNWYGGVFETLTKHMTEGDADMFVRFLAATSAGTQATSTNIHQAKKAFVQWKMGEPFLAAGRYPSPWRGATGKMLNEAVKTNVFGDLKIQNYYKALMGDPNAVVIDDWMARIFGWGQATYKLKVPGKKDRSVSLRFDPETRLFASKNRPEIEPRGFEIGTGEKTAPFGFKGRPATDDDYEFAAQIVRDVADHFGMTPVDAQAAIWGGIKKIYEELGLTRPDNVGPYRETLDELIPATGRGKNAGPTALVDRLFNELRQGRRGWKKDREAFGKQTAEVIAYSVQDAAKKMDVDIDTLLKTLVLIGSPALMAAYSEDERKSKGLLALMAIGGAHGMSKAGVFKGLRPVGDSLWENVFVGGANQVARAADWLGAGNFFFTNRSLGPDFRDLKAGLKRERSEVVMRAHEFKNRVDNYGEAFSRVLSRGIDEGWDEERFAAALTGQGIDASDAKAIKDVHDTFEFLGENLVSLQWISSESFEKYRRRYAPRLYDTGAFPKGERKARGQSFAPEGPAQFNPDRDFALDRTRRRGDEPNPDLPLIEDGGFRVALGMIQEGHLVAVGRFTEAVAGNKNWTDPVVRQLSARKADIELELATVNRGDAGGIEIGAGGARVPDDAPDPMALQRELDELDQRIRDAGIEAGRRGLVQMPDDARYGALRGQWVRPEIKSDLEGFVKMDSTIGKAFAWYEENLLRPWKKTKTIYNPATHGRNLLGAQLLSNLGGGPVPFGPSFTKALASLRRESGDLYDQARRFGLLDSGAVDGLQLAPLGQGSVPRDALQGARDQLSRAGGKTQAIMTLGASAVPGLDDKLTKLYTQGDQVARVAHFDHAMRVRGMSPAEAAQDALKWVPTYDNLSNASKLWSKTGAPFWAYTAVSLPRVAEAAVKHPIRFMTFGALAYAFDQLFTDGEVPEGVMPPEMRGAGAGVPGIPEGARKVMDFMLPTQFASPFGQGPDKRNFIDLTYVFPYGDIAEGRGRDTGPLGVLPANFNPGQAGGPILNQLKELSLNKVHFTGRPITRPHMSTGEAASAVTDYLYKSNMPSLAPAIPGVTEGGYGFQRLRDAAMGRPNYMGDTRSVGSAVADAIFGLKQRQIDLPTELRRRVATLEAEIRSANQALSNVLRDARSSERAKAEARERTRNQVQELQQQIQDLLREAQAAGITPGR